MDPNKNNEDIDDDASVASKQAVADIITKASSAAVEVTLDNESKASREATPTIVDDIIRSASSTAMDVTLANDKTKETAAVDSLDDGEDYLSLSLDGSSSMTMAEPSQIEDAGIETEPIPMAVVTSPPVQKEEEIVEPLLSTITPTKADGGIDTESPAQLDGGFSAVSLVSSTDIFSPLPSDSISTFGGGVNGTLESDSELIENMVAATMTETEKLVLNPLPEVVVETNNDEQLQEPSLPPSSEQQQPAPEEEEKNLYNDETFDTLSPMKPVDKSNRVEGLSGNNNNNDNNDDNDNGNNQSRENLKTADSDVSYGEEGFEDTSAPPRYTLTII